MDWGDILWDLYLTGLLPFPQRRDPLSDIKALYGGILVEMG